MEFHLYLLFFALIADRYVGEPDWLWSKLPHPVMFFGMAIEWAERLLLDEASASDLKQRNGVIAVAGLLVASAFAGWLISSALSLIPVVGWLLEIGVVAIFLAQKSLADHVSAVATGLREGGLEGGRKAVSMIVGRDPDTLDESGVSRAAIESLAENTSDGIIAPAFWYVLLGLPGLFAYKMLNTADSMIGHRSERYIDFGWASAKADDVANWMPARLTGFLAVAAGYTIYGKEAASRANDLMMRDARLHKSPNAGWPESAFAAVLGLALAGPRVYGGEETADPWLNAPGRAEAKPADIDRAVSLFWRLCSIFAGAVFLLAMLL